MFTFLLIHQNIFKLEWYELETTTKMHTLVIDVFKTDIRSIKTSETCKGINNFLVFTSIVISQVTQEHIMHYAITIQGFGPKASRIASVYARDVRSRQNQSLEITKVSIELCFLKPSYLKEEWEMFNFLKTHNDVLTLWYVVYNWR